MGKTIKLDKLKPTRPIKGTTNHLLANLDKEVMCIKTSDGNFSFNLLHYDVEIQEGWVRIDLKDSTRRKIHEQKRKQKGSAKANRHRR